MAEEVVIPKRQAVVFVDERTGQKYEATKPKGGVVRQYLKTVQEAADGKDASKLFTLMSDFVVACGLPETFVDELDMDGLAACVKALMPAEKKT